MAIALSDPAVPAPFTWAGEHLRADLGHGARAVFTTRRGGVSTAARASLDLALDGQPENVRRLADAVGVDPGRIVRSRQTHETVVQVVAGPAPFVEGVDGHATAAPHTPLLVLTADCLPVALAAEGAVAMIHAGWRGLAGGILAEGVRALRQAGGDGPVTAAIGPGAGGCCYEVGDEVRGAFADVPEARDGRLIDLKRVAAVRLGAAGVDVVHDVGLCTMCSDPSLFFSHRRDGAGTGRQAGVAWRS